MNEAAIDQPVIGDIDRMMLPCGDAVIEFFVKPPSGPGPHPAVLFVHGHQTELVRPGGRWPITRGYFDRAVTAGYVAASISMPGYGFTSGPPDFCGPRTQDAVRAGLAKLRSLSCVDPSKIALWGRSRGAVTAAMVATMEPDLCAVALLCGAYDFRDAYRKTQPGIVPYIEREAGTSEEAHRARSPLLFADLIKAPTIIVHGDRDDVCPPEHASELHRRLLANGTQVKLVMYAGADHWPPEDLINAEVDRFFAGWLRPTQTGPVAVPERGPA
ncbi:dipeptidyl aminopeptidase/acylaminoacyl peptidase [Azospirillum sp. OGB3]|uniref:alpha/beta hydrolase family protein n=1 Tax=Azospirillum sp. OGB3 TaxID=2587012 RepID=UPI001606E2AB|nr:prolyl oligopeptidase family serine peptidase [Azospirillum sp. OGB3]MBB3268725.1 dipeptidyl aminopeptidase/acylaminoacyl peptidase [Azospirillum sp. OGB3]